VLFELLVTASDDATVIGNHQRGYPGGAGINSQNRQGFLLETAALPKTYRQ
jgi:hypothetical protein